MDREKASDSRFCPVNSRKWVGDRFVSDCAHHHPVFRYRTRWVVFAFSPRNGAFCALPLVSLSVPGDRKARFCPPVSASKISVPGAGGDRFEDRVVGLQFEPYCLHHPALANRRCRRQRQIGRFRGDFWPLISWILVSASTRAFGRRFLVPCLCIQKFRSRRPKSSAKPGDIEAVLRELRYRNTRSPGRLSGYSGLSPRASICRLHAVGGSRSRSMPIPRGKRPSTAALTRLGARGERDCHVDVPNAALLADTKLCDRGHPTRDDIIQPPTTSGDRADQTRAALELLRPNVTSRCAVRDQDLTRSFGGWLPPGN